MTTQSRKVPSMKVLVIVLFASIVLNFGLTYETISAKKLAKRIEDPFNRKRLFESFPVDSGAIFFVGNSLTEQFEVSEFFQNAKIKNRGINGDLTQSMLNRLNPILANHPKKIFVEIGINDLRKGTSPDSLLSLYKKAFEQIDSNSGETEVYISSIFPVDSKQHKNLTNTTISSVNSQLNSLCSERGFTFINTFDRFSKGGQVVPELFLSDGLHLSAEGYKVWAEILSPYVN